jgi:hypothetical protein
MPDPPSYPPRTISLPKAGSPRRSLSPPRSSSPTEWGDDVPVVAIAAGSLATAPGAGADDVVPTGFDEAVLRSLCELDVSRVSFVRTR